MSMNSQALLSSESGTYMSPHLEPVWALGTECSESDVL